MAAPARLAASSSCLLAALFVVLLSWPLAAKGALPPGLFIFGDSYVDIGNRNHSSADWKSPYGETWPGHPAGRYSNGRNLGDWLPMILGLPAEPPPFRQLLNLTGTPPLGTFTPRYGINFAVGGSGVFNDFGYPTFDHQISQFAALIKRNLWTPSFLARSYYFISTGNNDYLYVVDFKNPQALEHLANYSRSIVVAIDAGIRRLYSLGARTIITTNLMPIGCLPIGRALTADLGCNPIGTDVANRHNADLYAALPYLRALPGSRIVIADIHKAFLEVEAIQNNWAGVKFANVKLACCDPDAGGTLCGKTSKVFGITVNDYKLCSNPQDHFFWDTVHLTDMGFRTIAHLWGFGYTYTNPGPNLRSLP